MNEQRISVSELRSSATQYRAFGNMIVRAEKVLALVEAVEAAHEAVEWLDLDARVDLDRALAKFDFGSGS